MNYFGQKSASPRKPYRETFIRTDPVTGKRYQAVKFDRNRGVWISRTAIEEYKADIKNGLTSANHYSWAGQAKNTNQRELALFIAREEIEEERRIEKLKKLAELHRRMSLIIAREESASLARDRAKLGRIESELADYDLQRRVERSRGKRMVRKVY